MTLTQQQTGTPDDQRAALALAGTNDGLWDWDLTSDRVFFSDRWKSMLGYAPDEVGDTLQEWRSRVHPDELDWVMQAVKQHLAGQTERYVTEHRMRHKDGHDLWILDRGQAQLDADGCALRMIGFHTDVTERRLAKDAAKSLSRELATILELSPDGFVAFDDTGRVKYVSPAFGSMTQTLANQVTGLDEEQFWHLMASLSKDRSLAGGVPAIRHNLSQTTNQRRSVLELSRSAGRFLEITQRSSQAGTIAKILCFRDVSHETELDRLKGEFMSNAAHELRTPLASIYGFAETLLIADPEDASRREFTGIIYQQAQAMTRLLNEMLDLARIEARRQTDFVFSVVDIRAQVQAVVSGFKRPEGREAAQLEMSQGGLQVLVDPDKIKQVLLNVLSNAYKYSPTGGPVLVHIDRVAPANAPPQAAIHITDHGMGMSPEQLAHMFERFYRANPASVIPGTGLGMCIVKEIMTLLGGHVEIQSAPGAGTRVSLYLPLAQTD